jgi:hypothetical protein
MWVQVGDPGWIHIADSEASGMAQAVAVDRVDVERAVLAVYQATVRERYIAHFGQDTWR